MSMAHLLFVRDFEAEIDAERLLAERQAVVHTADDLREASAAARAEGHAAGLAEGLASGWREALASIEAQRLEAIGKLATAVDALLADRAEHRQRLEAEMTAFAGDLADRVFPELVRQLGTSRVDEEIKRVMGRAIGSPSLQIRLSPNVANVLADDLIEMGTQSGQQVRVLPDPALEPTEVHASWQDGRSRYSFAAICRSIQSMIRRAVPQSILTDDAGAKHE
jgi:flagellar biosynthesis/type III secretory pathway protein FliH